jgi:hypothetical protein
VLIKEFLLPPSPVPISNPVTPKFIVTDDEETEGYGCQPNRVAKT